MFRVTIKAVVCVFFLVMHFISFKMIFFLKLMFRFWISPLLEQPQTGKYMGNNLIPGTFDHI